MFREPSHEQFSRVLPARGADELDHPLFQAGIPPGVKREGDGQDLATLNQVPLVCLTFE